MRIRAASRVITAVNPDTAATLRRYTGSTQAADYSRTPTFATSSGTVQVQDLESWELKKLEGLNLSDVPRKVYLDGSWNSVDRQAVSGGDQMVFSGWIWKVVRVMEQFPDWTSLAVVKLSTAPSE